MRILTLAYSSLKLIQRNIISVLTYNRLRYLPDLNEIVFSSAANYPRLSLVPAEICQVIGMATMHEKPV
jgi:hypothetical protein